MEWTTDKPSKPGWYWWRTEGSVEITRVYIMVWNEADQEVRPWCSWGWIAQLEGEWAGPIPEPTERTEGA